MLRAEIRIVDFDPARSGEADLDWRSVDEWLRSAVVKTNG